MSAIPPRLRTAAYIRDGSQCVPCGVYLPPGQRQAHHRLFLGRGGKHELANLITVCRKCHADIHIHDQETATCNGWAIPSGGRPTEVPVLYWHSRKVFLSNSPESEVA